MTDFEIFIAMLERNEIKHQVRNDADYIQRCPDGCLQSITVINTVGLGNVDLESEWFFGLGGKLLSTGAYTV